MKIKLPPSPNVPYVPTPDQFKQARKLLKLSEDKTPEATDELSLPVDKSALRAIEAGETPQRPTKTSGPRNIDYYGKSDIGEKLYAQIDYHQRLLLFYQLKGVVFFRDGDVKRADPHDLFGHLAALPNEHCDVWNENLAKLSNSSTFDPLRILLDKALQQKK
ncbi:hypothetical protein [Aliiroseovarius lamellibrachiae]|uniref:hypothetical protein n=1 Tax=Aliiroseovarius lamellibrachiae TaxID=1924933 RepID=UPI001BDF996C|nr:hypothetical protein [Aliiroseovarius lamellibrachiae]MBT2132194.1 hypothetical protein [Aliiroseovarius lamellibrachiae]